MKRTFLRLAALSSGVAALLLTCRMFSPARASERPRYGGILRIEMRERVNSMDPRGLNLDAADGPAAERMLGLVFDRLVRLDDAGQPRAALAVSWLSKANFTHWEFQLRGAVKFHDGTLLSPTEVVAALQAEDSERWPASVSNGAVAFDFKNPRPNLLNELSEGRSFIFHAAQDTIFGTGPFRIADWQAQKKLALIANEDDWAGRPFVDRIEISLGVATRQQLVDLELGKADVVELQPNLTQRAAQTSSTRMWSSSPVELFALVVTGKRATFRDPRMSQALSLAIDRAAIVNVLLQRQGEPAGGMLPQWISGYAFLFPTAPNVAQAKGLIEQVRQPRGQLSTLPPITLVYDGADAVAETVAARVAVNARDAGISLTIIAENGGTAAANADLRLVRRRIAAPNPQQALLGLLNLDLNAIAGSQVSGFETPEARYLAEKAELDTGNIIPIVFLPELYALGPSVRDWMPPRWGGWRLEDVWLDPGTRAEPAGNNKQ
jgi:peptide/nickel transport system substrate-binding protein